MNYRYRPLFALMSAFLMFGALAPSRAQTGPLPTLAAVTDGHVTVYGGAGSRLVDGVYPAYYSLVWNADGSRLAYTAFDGVQTRLLLTDRTASPPVTLAEGVSYLPVTFTLDGSEVVYTVEDPAQTGQTIGGLPAAGMTVMITGLDGASAPRMIGTILIGVGCGGGSPFPMDAVYNTEAGFGGSALTFAVTPHGILYSTSCSGIGLGVFNPDTGESRVLGDDLSRARVSPEGDRALVVRGGGVAVLEIASGQVTALAASNAPDQIAWGEAGAAYYSTRTLAPEPVPFSPEEASAFSAYLGAEAATLPQYTVSLYRVNAGGGDTLVYTGPGWAVGRLFSVQGDVYFSLVPNGEAWVEAITAGLIDFSAAESWQREQQTVAARLYRLNADGSATELGAGIGQAVPNPAG